jgi:glutamate racemase
MMTRKTYLQNIVNNLGENTQIPVSVMTCGELVEYIEELEELRTFKKSCEHPVLHPEISVAQVDA